MGCGVSGCLSKKTAGADQPRAIHGPSSLYPPSWNSQGLDREDTIVDGVCLKEANAGHYFAEGELFGAGTKHSAINQLHYRLDKWWTMCTFRQNRSPDRKITFLIFLHRTRRMCICQE